MKKQQIIAPLVAMAIFALVGGFIVSRNQSRNFLRAFAGAAGRELITATNSPKIHLLGPGLRSRLEVLLGSPAEVDFVKLGDAPVGDGRASVCLFLKNQDGMRIGIRLRYNADIKQLDVLGFWTP